MRREDELYGAGIPLNVYMQILDYVWPNLMNEG